MSYDDNNIFAKILRGELPAARVFEDAHTLAIMDVMPQADGHTLVLPKTPAENLFDLPDQASAQVMHTTRRIAAAIRTAFRADGLRLMQFNGSAAGQTVFHFHMHIIPCHAGQALRGHARGMAEMPLLLEHAARIQAALQKFD
jgi:histidine triad (HIT) family protein